MGVPVEGVWGAARVGRAPVAIFCSAFSLLKQRSFGGLCFVKVH